MDSNRKAFSCGNSYDDKQTIWYHYFQLILTHISEFLEKLQIVSSDFFLISIFFNTEG